MNAEGHNRKWARQETPVSRRERSSGAELPRPSRSSAPMLFAMWQEMVSTEVCTFCEQFQAFLMSFGSNPELR